MASFEKPTKEDARIMLQLEELLLMEPNHRAMYWFWRVFQPQKLETPEEIRKTYPPTSEGQQHLYRIASFWESAGAIVKNGLLNEHLFFDRFFVKPYWDALKPIVSLDRQESNEPRIAENFEWLARREKTWAKKQSKRSKTKASRR